MSNAALLMLGTVVCGTLIIVGIVEFIAYRRRQHDRFCDDR
jgi:hypothetical protein